MFCVIPWTLSGNTDISRQNLCPIGLHEVSPKMLKWIIKVIFEGPLNETSTVSLIFPDFDFHSNLQI